MPRHDQFDFLVHDFECLEETFALVLSFGDETLQLRHERLFYFFALLRDEELSDFVERGLGQRREVNDSCVQKDGRVVLDDVFQIRLVRFDAQHHFQVLAQVQLVDLLQRPGLQGLVLGFESAHVVHDLEPLVFGLVERQVPVVEEVVDVVGRAFVAEVAVGKEQALAVELAVLAVGPALHDCFLESVVELDLLFACLECLHFQFALPDQEASQLGGERASVAFVADLYSIALVLEQCPHGLAYLPQRVID